MAEQPWDKFAPVPGTQVLFSIWDTRLEDFRAFVENAGYDATGGMWSLGQDGWKQLGATWKEPGFSQGPTDPGRGRKLGRCKGVLRMADAARARFWGAARGHALKATDRPGVERSSGIDSERGNTPEEKNSKIRLYQWSTRWPRRLELVITAEWRQRLETNRKI